MPRPDEDARKLSLEKIRRALTLDLAVKDQRHKRRMIRRRKKRQLDEKFRAWGDGFEDTERTLKAQKRSPRSKRWITEYENTFFPPLSFEPSKPIFVHPLDRETSATGNVQSTDSSRRVSQGSSWSNSSTASEDASTYSTSTHEESSSLHSETNSQFCRTFRQSQLPHTMIENPLPVSLSGSEKGDRASPEAENQPQDEATWRGFSPTRASNMKPTRSIQADSRQSDAAFIIPRLPNAFSETERASSLPGPQPLYAQRSGMTRAEMLPGQSHHSVAPALA